MIVKMIALMIALIVALMHDIVILLPMVHLLQVSAYDAFFRVISVNISCDTVPRKRYC